MPLPGADQPELVLDFSRPEQSGEYLLQAFNPHGSVFSRPAAVTLESRMLLSPQLAGGETELRVLFNAPEGSRYLIEGSSDATNWRPVLEMHHAQNPAILSLPLRPEADRAFFAPASNQPRMPVRRSEVPLMSRQPAVRAVWAHLRVIALALKP
jgi:hypothetical protein